MIRISIALAVCSLTAVAGPLGPALAAKDETIFISHQNAADGGAGADADASRPVISGDGRHVTFNSSADNLSTVDNSVEDVFSFDTQTNILSLISRASGVAGAAGDGKSEAPSISADGRYVAFESGANNLVTGENEAVINVFVRDTQTNTTTLISRQSAGDGGAGGDGDSQDASISANGRYVAFQSAADNLVTGEDEAVTNVFVRDTQTNTTTFVSQSSTGDSGDGSSERPSISGDGNVVAFDSAADNLGGGVGGTSDIFLRDVQAGTTTLVSRQSAADGGAAADGSSLAAAVTPDGRYVAFESAAGNFSDADSTSSTDVFVRDLQTSTTTFVSRASGADGVGDDDGGGEPAISSDGRYVTWYSYGTNLDPDDTDSDASIYMRDLQTDTTTLVSRQSVADGGASADGESYYSSLSGDGRFMAFDSFASNLSNLADATHSNVYLRDLQGPPTASPGGGSAPSGGSAPGASKDSKAPGLTAAAGSKASLAKSALVVTVSCDEACTATASGSVSVPGTSKAFRLKPVTRALPAGARTKLTLKLSKKLIKAAKRALKKRKRVNATVNVGAADAAGNSSKAQRRMRLVR